MRKFLSKNPYNNQILSSFDYLSQPQLKEKIVKGHNSYLAYEQYHFKKKAALLMKLSDYIEANAAKYAKLITSETGKPIQQATEEVKKSAAYCRYYVEAGEKIIKPRRVKTEAKESYYQYNALGLVYVISPFNFPFWLCFKPIIPQLLLGNTIIHRPSDSTPLVGLAIEELFNQSGFNEFQFQNVFSSYEQLEIIMAHKNVHGVSFTGSSNAGKVISSIAGKHLKRSVMELGGSDPFMVFDNANIQKAVEIAISSRAANCGQVCFSAKRFIIHEKKYEQFKKELCIKLSKLQIGDPLLPETQIGPMARGDLVLNLQKQIDQGVSEGAKIVFQGVVKDELKSTGNFFAPTVVECLPSNSLVTEETFGLLFPLIKATSNEHIIQIANKSKYGLGAVIITEDTKNVKSYIDQLHTGMVFVNEKVKSDARLPSGGIKESGFGRECCEYGVENFANIKTVWIQ